MTQQARADYEQFLRSKMITAPERGIEINASAINPLLKPHQAAIVRWAVHKGNAAIFAAFGLGKTFMQLEIARLISAHAGGKFLIVAPLGVRQEFKRDAEKLGIAIEIIHLTQRPIPANLCAWTSAQSTPSSPPMKIA